MIYFPYIIMMYFPSQFITNPTILDGFKYFVTESHHVSHRGESLHPSPRF